MSDIIQAMAEQHTNYLEIQFAFVWQFVSVRAQRNPSGSTAQLPLTLIWLLWIHCIFKTSTTCECIWRQRCEELWQNIWQHSGLVSRFLELKKQQKTNISSSMQWSKTSRNMKQEQSSLWKWDMHAFTWKIHKKLQFLLESPVFIHHIEKSQGEQRTEDQIY